jgi:hypothetical protein
LNCDGICCSCSQDLENILLLLFYTSVNNTYVCLYRREGFAKYRSEESPEEKAIRIATFFVKVDAKNVGEVAILLRRINDANIETTSKKSKAQEVEAIYALQDKSEAEMLKILTPEVSKGR